MAESIQAILERQSNSLARFVELLQSEQLSLTKGEVAQLPAINQNKAELITVLNQCDEERYRQLVAAGHRGDATGMHSWLTSQSGNAGKLWQKILLLAREAKELNRLNGQLIATRLQATDEALAALNVKARENSLYSPRGLSGSFTGSRIIDSA